ITASANNGNINVLFSKVNQSSPTTVTTVAGNINVTMPKDTPAHLSLKSMMGDIYTNFKLDVPNKEGLKGISNHNIVVEINKGGVQIKLNSTMGNIYLRDKN